MIFALGLAYYIGRAVTLRYRAGESKYFTRELWGWLCGCLIVLILGCFKYSKDKAPGKNDCLYRALKQQARLQNATISMNDRKVTRKPVNAAAELNSEPGLYRVPKYGKLIVPPVKSPSFQRTESLAQMMMGRVSALENPSALPSALSEMHQQANASSASADEAPSISGIVRKSGRRPQAFDLDPSTPYDTLNTRINIEVGQQRVSYNTVPRLIMSAPEPLGQTISRPPTSKGSTLFQPAI